MPKFERALRKVPAFRWIVLGELLMLAREHAMMLEPHERRRVVELVRKGGAHRGQLSERERRELAQLVGKAEPRLFVQSASKKVTGIRFPRRGR